MQVNLENKTAVITHAAGAIGTAVAKAYAKNGAAVVLADKDEAQVQALAQAIIAEGGKALAVKADTGVAEEAAAIIAKAVEAFGSVDVVLNAADTNGGPETRKPVGEYCTCLWNEIMKDDLTGVFYTCKAAVQQMQKQGKGGSIINVGSVLGTLPAVKQVGFATAMAGLIGMTKAMAQDTAVDSIRVNCITTGFMPGDDSWKEGPQAAEDGIMAHIPLNRVQTAEDVVGAACFLADEAAAYLTGAVLTADGGFACSTTRHF